MTDDDHRAAPGRAMRADARRNRKRVIAAARKCMARDGLDAQMEEIARCAKVGVGTVYRHFPNKEDLVEALAADRFERLAELGPRGARAGGSRAGVRRVRARPRPGSRARTGPSRRCSPRARRRCAGRPRRSACWGWSAEVIGRAQAAGAIRADARPEDIPMLMCALAGTYRNPTTDPERYIAIILDGLRAPGSTPLR